MYPNNFCTKKVIRETRHFLAQNVNFIEACLQHVCSMFAKIFQVHLDETGKYRKPVEFHVRIVIADKRLHR